MTMIRKLIGAQISNLAADEVEVVMSTAALARDGHVLVPQGCRLADYLKNPIVLWGHNPDYPIGNAENVAVTPQRISCRIRFAPPGLSQKADEIRGLTKAGVIRAVSVGFEPIDMEPLDPKKPRGGQRITAWTLLELSVVAVPADTGAVVTARSGHAPQWSCEAAANLPIDHRDHWDPQEASDSIFEFAGSDGYDPVIAKRGFLIHDASNPGARRSYKLPIARAAGDGMCVHPRAIADAAAGLAQMELPNSVRIRAESILDGYRDKAVMGGRSFGSGDFARRQRQVELLKLQYPPESDDFKRRQRAIEVLKLSTSSIALRGHDYSQRQCDLARLRRGSR